MNKLTIQDAYLLLNDPNNTFDLTPQELALIKESIKSDIKEKIGSIAEQTVPVNTEAQNYQLH